MLDGVNVVQLPDRSGGVWLLWLTDLPEQAESEFRSTVFEVTFRSS